MIYTWYWPLATWIQWFNILKNVFKITLTKSLSVFSFHSSPNTVEKDPKAKRIVYSIAWNYFYHLIP